MGFERQFESEEKVKCQGYFRPRNKHICCTLSKSNLYSGSVGRENWGKPFSLGTSIVLKKAFIGLMITSKITLKETLI